MDQINDTTYRMDQINVNTSIKTQVNSIDRDPIKYQEPNQLYI